MKESWESYVQLGLVHFMAYPQCIKGEGPILETLELIVTDDFFDVVEVGWIKDDATRAKARDLFRSGHIAVGYGAQPQLLVQKLDLNSIDPAERRKAVVEVKRAADHARFLGAVGLAFLSGKAADPSKTTEYKDALVDSCIEICEHAAPMPVHLETFDTDADKCCLVGSSALAREIAVRVRRRCANFGLLVDLSHLPLQREKPSVAIPTVGELLTHVHVGNAYLADTTDPAWGDNHPRFGYPGGFNDVAELTEYLVQLFKIGYLGPGKRPIVSFEVKPVAGENNAAVIANAKRTWRAAWARL